MFVLLGQVMDDDDDNVDCDYDDDVLLYPQVNGSINSTSHF